MSEQGGGKGWGSREFAEAWKRRGEERQRTMAAMTERMFAAARIGPGMRVLDLGTGTGDTAILAAGRASAGGARGTVLATDASEAMVEATRQAVEASGATNVEVRRMDASAIDVEAGAFDAVIARQVLMFTDRPRALAGILRALRPGGRFAATVWGREVDNPYHHVTLEAARKRGGWGEPTPEVVRAFSVGDPEEWRRALTAAGFADVSLEPVTGERRFGSPAEALAAMRDSPIHREPIERLPPALQEEAWKETEAVCVAAGGVFPTLHLVLSGEKR
jgi:ubiquinone/menaquinone biosynthesis C-methylase UbiE